MGYEVRKEIPFTIVKLPARVDVTNTQGLLDAVRSQMGAGSDRFILDLSETEAIDSTGIGVIVSLYKSLRVGEGDLLLASVGSGVARVLALTRLDRVFQLHDSVESAKAAETRAS